MDTVQTMIHNQMDFYLYFGIGIALTIAVVGMVKMSRSFKKEPGQKAEFSKLFEVNKKRGDISVWVAAGMYLFSTTSYILLCIYLLKGRFPFIFFVIYGIVWSPFISYICARMEGIAGQFTTIPMVREATFILSGYKGVDIWFIPVPIHNYGAEAVSFKQIELTGTKLWGIIKAQFVVFPIVLCTSIIFSQFLWRLADVPSPQYPFAQKMWELNAFNSLVMVTSTKEGYSPFIENFSFWYVGAGMGIGLVTYAVLSSLGLPIMLVYGLVRGLNQMMPHGIIPEFAGALLGRYYFQKRFGSMWRQYIPVVIAGYSCGMGLIGMASIALALITKSLSNLLY
jgi:hypothetical protein